MTGMAITVVLAAVSATAQPGRADRGCFPPLSDVNASLRAIDRDFLAAERGKDNWLGFVPIVSAVAEHQGGAPLDVVSSVECEVVSRFVLYSFACEYDDDDAKADFGGRIAAVNLLGRFSLVQSDTNVVFRLADWLGGAVPLTADRNAELADCAEAFRRDVLMIYGGSRPPRYPGSSGNTSHLGPAARQCREKYRFRRLYNERLPAFRVAALAAFRKAVVEGFEDRSAEERDAIWDEFCRRANATEAEGRAAVSALQEKPAGTVP